MKKHLFFWVRIAVSIGAVSFVLFSFRDRLDDVVGLLTGLRWPFALAAFLLLLCSQLFITARWREILRAQDVCIRYSSLLRLTLIGLFFNNFLPSALGGDVVKAYYAGKHAGKRMEPYTAVFTDRAIGYVTMIFWSVLAVSLYRDKIHNNTILYAVGVMAAFALLLILFFASRKIARPYHWLIQWVPSDRRRDQLERLYDSVSGYRKHTGLMLLSVGLSACSQFVMILMNLMLARGLGLSLSLSTLMLTLPIIAVVQNAPSINGVGVRDSAYIFFLGEYVTGEGALALAIMYYVVYLSVSLCGGLVYATRGGGISLGEVRGAGA